MKYEMLIPSSVPDWRARALGGVQARSWVCLWHRPVLCDSANGHPLTLAAPDKIIPVKNQRLKTGPHHQGFRDFSIAAPWTASCN